MMTADAPGQDVEITGDSPLHVRVGHALRPDADVVITFPQNVSMPQEGGAFPSLTPRGVYHWLVRLQPDHDCIYVWEGEPCECSPVWLEKIPRYDEDWRETGPLIERLAWGLHRMLNDETWIAAPRGAHPRGVAGIGPTPLIAVCNLILSLSAAGRLDVGIQQWERGE